MPYDPKELLPVAACREPVVTLAVPASMNVGSLKEFLTQAREQSGKNDWATAVTMTDIILEGFLQVVRASTWRTSATRTRCRR